MTLEQFLDMVEALARRNDGHLTIYRFTSCWKAQQGTPDVGAGAEYVMLGTLKSHPTLVAAIVDMLAWAPLLDISANIATLDHLIHAIEALAALRDGHITIYRFTSCWKAHLGTPVVDQDARAVIGSLPACPTLVSAIAAAG
jgi:hypothetical protein